MPTDAPVTPEPEIKAQFPDQPGNLAALAGFLLVISVAAVVTGLAAWLVRRYSPQASGSDIPRVEAVLNEELPQAPFRLIPVKFIDVLLAIGTDLALGREGPSVQMGASTAHLLGVVLRRSWPDCKTLLAAGAVPAWPLHLTLQSRAPSLY